MDFGIGSALPRCLQDAPVRDHTESHCWHIIPQFHAIRSLSTTMSCLWPCGDLAVNHVWVLSVECSCNMQMHAAHHSIWTVSHVSPQMIPNAFCSQLVSQSICGPDSSCCGRCHPKRPELVSLASKKTWTNQGQASCQMLSVGILVFHRFLGLGYFQISKRLSTAFDQGSQIHTSGTGGIRAWSGCAANSTGPIWAKLVTWHQLWTRWQNPAFVATAMPRSIRKSERLKIYTAVCSIHDLITC